MPYGGDALVPCQLAVDSNLVETKPTHQSAKLSVASRVMFGGAFFVNVVKAWRYMGIAWAVAEVLGGVLLSIFVVRRARRRPQP